MPYLLVVSASSPYRTLKDLLAAARARPDSVTFSSAGSGSSSHLSGELFNVTAGVQTRHIPYKGAPAAITDVMSGRVDMFFAPSITALQFVKDGKLRSAINPLPFFSRPDNNSVSRTCEPSVGWILCCPGVAGRRCRECGAQKIEASRGLTAIWRLANGLDEQGEAQPGGRNPAPCLQEPDVDRLGRNIPPRHLSAQFFALTRKPGSKTSTVQIQGEFAPDLQYLFPQRAVIGPVVVPALKFRPSGKAGWNR